MITFLLDSILDLALTEQLFVASPSPDKLIGSMPLGIYCNKSYVRTLLFVTKMGQELDFLITDNRNKCIYIFLSDV